MSALMAVAAFFCPAVARSCCLSCVRCRRCGWLLALVCLHSRAAAELLTIGTVVSPPSSCRCPPL
eukprot:7152220-Lingulodinium_polyedra.AAC.1